MHCYDEKSRTLNNIFRHSVGLQFFFSNYDSKIKNKNKKKIIVSLGKQVANIDWLKDFKKNGKCAFFMFPNISFEKKTGLIIHGRLSAAIYESYGNLLAKRN